MNCAQCGQPARFIEQYGQWWCDACQHYTRGPAPPGAVAAGAAPKSSIGGKVLKVIGALFVVAFGLGLVGSLLGDDHKAEVSVFCKGIAAGVECTARHTSGGANAKACFDVSFACEDGSKAIAKRCMTVAPEDTSTQLIKVEAFSKADTCAPVPGSLEVAIGKVSKAD